MKNFEINSTLPFINIHQRSSKNKIIHIKMYSSSNRIIVVDGPLFKKLKKMGIPEIPKEKQKNKLPRGPRTKYAEYEAKWVPQFEVWVCTEESTVRIGKGNQSTWYQY